MLSKYFSIFKMEEGSGTEWRFKSTFNDKHTLKGNVFIDL